jgi:surfactin synthase thioesterase subunit
MIPATLDGVHQGEVTTRRPTVIPFRGTEPPAVRLLCIGHAGTGAAMFNPWRKALPPWVEVLGVRLPGRESRNGDAPLTELAPMVDMIIDDLTAMDTSVPLACYGHCFGGVLGYHLVRRLEQDDELDLVHLLVSSAPDPRTASGDGDPVHRKTTAELVAFLTTTGAMPPDSRTSADLMTLMEPAIRGDFQAIETIPDARHTVIRTPITVLRGAGDTILPDAVSRGWATCTTGDFSLRILPGGHFLLDTALPRVQAVIASRLAAAVR